MTSHSTATKGSERRAGKAPPDDPDKKSGKQRIFVVAGIAVVLGAAALMIAFAMGLGQKAPDTTLRFSGRIEGAETRIGTRMPARVKSVSIKEGDSVRKGQLVLSLENQDVIAKLRSARSGMAVAAETANAARKKAEMLDGAARKAASAGFFGKVFGGAKAKAEKLRMEAEGAKLEQRIARAEIARAQAAKDEVSANLSYFRITSPTDGVCTNRSVEPGDLVSPVQTLLTVVNLSSVYFKGFIPESELPRVKIGQRATVILDSAPSTPLSAKVTSIDNEASFTPENIYFKEDKVKQVFGVELSVDNRSRIAKPGMSAEAIINRAQPERR